MRRTLGAAVLTAAVAAACGDAAEEEVPLQQGPAEAPAAVGEERPADAGAGAVLRVDSLAGAGAYLTDGSGRALYLLEGEPSDSSTCYDACAEEWPPFLAPQGSPTAGAAPVREDLISTVPRRDGRTQVAYAGHPLYYYHDDTGPGEAQGQDVTDQWGEWYLVTPAGDALHAEGHGGH